MLPMKMLLLKELYLLRQRLLHAYPNEIRVLHDPENIKIEKGALFPDIITFRKAVRHYTVKTCFELAPSIKTDPTRYIARCKHPGCPWHIHASRIHD
jgi:hypothetical protein